MSSPARVLTAALLAVASAAPAAAQADLSRATCAQVLEIPRGDRGPFLLWLHGYYSGAAQRAVLDRARVERIVTDLMAACERNPATPLIGPEMRALMLGDPAPAAPASSTITAPPPPADQGQPRR